MHQECQHIRSRLSNAQQKLSSMVLQGDGAWAPKSGEKNTGAVAHGTHQNQYTKRKALLNSASLPDDSNEAEEEADESDEDKEEEEQADNCADTGFAAKSSNSKKASGKEMTAVKGQDQPALSQAGAKPSAVTSGSALEPKESGVSSKQPATEAQPQRSTRAGKKASGAVADGHSKDQPASKRRQGSILGRIVQNAEHSSGEVAPMDTSVPQSEPVKADNAVAEPESPQQLAERNSERDAHSAPEPNASKDSAAALHAPTSSTERNDSAQEDATDAVQDQPTKVNPAVDDASPCADKPSSKPASEPEQGGQASIDSKALSDSKAAVSERHRADSSNAQKHDEGKPRKAGTEDAGQRAAAGKDAKAASGLEEALQCEENLAEDTSASPGKLMLAYVFLIIYIIKSSHYW